MSYKQNYIFGQDLNHYENIKLVFGKYFLRKWVSWV